MSLSSLYPSVWSSPTPQRDVRNTVHGDPISGFPLFRSSRHGCTRFKHPFGWTGTLLRAIVAAKHAPAFNLVTCEYMFPLNMGSSVIVGYLSPFYVLSCVKGTQCTALQVKAFFILVSTMLELSVMMTEFTKNFIEILEDN